MSKEFKVCLWWWEGRALQCKHACFNTSWYFLIYKPKSKKTEDGLKVRIIKYQKFPSESMIRGRSLVSTDKISKELCETPGEEEATPGTWISWEIINPPLYCFFERIHFGVRRKNWFSSSSYWRYLKARQSFLSPSQKPLKMQRWAPSRTVCDETRFVPDKCYGSLTAGMLLFCRLPFSP